ncbi:MAG: glycosyltransferase [Sulfurihydrogenibium sp.]|jgi:GT2 family glycosyltransferase|nr:glycosyltransferase [Sulfurihydrogenibium sp.]
MSAVIICVNYNRDEETAKFVSNVLAQNDADRIRHIIVINNSESKIESLLPTNQKILIYNPGRNLGYFGGAWWGYQQYLKEFPLPEWIIVSNTDLYFSDANFFVKLFHYYEKNPPAVIAPAIYSEESFINQNPFMKQRPTSFRMHFYKWVYRYYISWIIYETLSILKEKLQSQFRNFCRKGKIQSDENPIKIYAPHGAFIIFHKSYFESGGTLESKTFLFGEEILVAETARKLNLDIIYDPRLQIIHKKHSTTNIFKYPHIWKYVKESSAYYADTFFKLKIKGGP